MIQKRDGDPYDTDSEPETGVLTSVIVDQNIPLERQLQQSRFLSLRGEHSTPNLQPNRSLYSVPIEKPSKKMKKKKLKATKILVRSLLSLINMLLLYFIALK